MRLSQLIAWYCFVTPLAFAAPPQNKISVDVNQRSGRISEYIYGASVEWVENGNRLIDPATHTLRPEILSLLSPLRIPIIRFPGGILADYYDWRDGVGDPAHRPSRQNPMDGSTHRNNFGTDEFVNLCKALHAQPLVTVNAGSGSQDLATGWQRYFATLNMPVKFWELGNELYLTEPKAHASIPGNDKRIFHTAEQYSKLVQSWAPALRARDSEALIGVVAGTTNTSAENRGWLDTLDKTGVLRQADFIALHDSFAPLILNKYDYANAELRNDAYRSMFAQAIAAGEDIHAVQGQIAAARPGEPHRIAITEHFPLYGAGGSHEQILAILDQSRTLGSALYTASLLQTYMRENVWMANYNLILSKWFGALITDTDDGLVLTPTYLVYDLYRNHFGEVLVETHTSSPTFSAKKVGAARVVSQVPLLDAVASVNTSGELFLAVINRDLKQSQLTELSITGPLSHDRVEILTLAGEPNAINGPSLSNTTRGGPKENVAIQRSVRSFAQDHTYSFPPSSLSILHWKKRRVGK
jgi:alpha-N-arabinofuranosidase